MKPRLATPRACELVGRPRDEASKVSLVKRERERKRRSSVPVRSIDPQGQTIIISEWGEDSVCFPIALDDELRPERYGEFLVLDENKRSD